MSLITTTNPIYKNDPIISKIIDAFQAELNKCTASGSVLRRQFLIATADEFLDKWESRYGVKIQSTLIEDRRNAIQAKSWSVGKIDIELIKKVANAWKNGEVNVLYEDEEVKLSFASVIGVPNDLSSLINAIDEIIPAHIGLSYTFNYLLIKEVESMTLSQLEKQKLSNFAH